MLEFDPKVRPQHCTTQGCNNEVPGIEVDGGMLWSPICGKCAAKLFQQSEADFQSEVRDNLHESQMRRMNIPEEFWPATLDNFEVDAFNRHAHNMAGDYAKAFRTGETAGGLILVGPTGRGKTHLAVAILQSVGEGFFIDQTELMDDVHREWRRDMESRGYITDCVSTPLLVLDDLYPEDEPDTIASWTKRTLYRIVNQRYNKRLPTIVTTNATVSELEARYGSRMVSRLMREAEVVSVNGLDHRTGH